jgi:WD40 repeat protein
VSFSPDGEQLAVVATDSVLLLNTETGDEVNEFSVSQPTHVRFSPRVGQRQILVAHGKGSFSILDADSGAILRTHSEVDASPVHSLEWDGGTVVSADGSRVHTWSSATGSGSLLTNSRRHGPAVSRDGRVCAWASRYSSSDRKDHEDGLPRSIVVVVLELVTGARTEIPLAGEALALSPTGTHLAVATRSGLYVLDLAGRTSLHLEGAGPVTAVCFAPDGESLLAVSERRLLQWSLRPR